MSILLRQGHIVTNDGLGTVFERGDVLIDGDRIAAVGPDLSELARARAVTREIDARDRVVLPGLIDAHMHSNEGFEMGRYDNLPLEIWLSEVYPPFFSSRLTARDKYLRAMMIAIISIRSGVTTLQDDVIDMAFTDEAVDATAGAYRDAGLRAAITTSFWDEGFCEGLPFVAGMMPPELAASLADSAIPSADEQIALFERLHARWSGKDNIRVILGPCGPQRCSVPLLHRVAELSETLDLPIHCHVLETVTQFATGREKYGCTLVQFLADAGCLTHRLTMNHAIWLTDRDIAIMGEAGCSTTHNPLANLKLGSGVSPVRKLLDAGVNVALGCDGVASSDSADIFQAFKAAALTHKIGAFDYRNWVSAHEVMHMATHGGARSMGMADDLGAIEAGRLADIILLDRKGWGMMPLHDPIQQIAFSASSEVVRSSIIGGRVVMDERRLTFVDEEALRGEIAEAAERFRIDEAPRMSVAAQKVRPWLDQMYAQASREISTTGLPEFNGRRLGALS